MANYKAKTGYDPEWFTREERSMTGIGGSAKSTSARKLYVGLGTFDGRQMPGKIISTEVADSNAPLPLSLQAPRRSAPWC